MRVHGSSDWHWVAGRCTVCGSITSEEAAARLSTAGTFFASSDWSYGWPDRMTIGADTFYAVHLVSLDDHELASFARLTRSTLGVIYERNEDGALDYQAVRRGFRTRGMVGEEHAPTVPRPPDGWWR